MTNPETAIVPGSPDLTPPGTQPGATPQGTPAGQPAAQPAMVPAYVMHEERTRRQVLEDENRRLKEENQAYQGYQQQFAPAQPAYGQPSGYTSAQQSYQQDTQQQQLDDLWANNPREAFRVELGSAFNFYDRVNASVDQQEQQLASDDRFRSDFSQYQNQIRSYIRQLPVAQRGKPGIVELAYYVIKGQASGQAQHQSYQQGAAAAAQAAAAAAGNVMGTGGSGGPANPPAQLTEQEKNAARVLGISEEDYQKNKR